MGIIVLLLAYEAGTSLPRATKRVRQDGSGGR